MSAATKTASAASPPAAVEENCEGCRFFKSPNVTAQLEKAGFGQRPGACRRWPDPVQKPPYEWCGEWTAANAPKSSGYQG
jgi:hypothetical protein